MPNNNPATTIASSHAVAARLLRRPFAPGAIGFRAMTKVAYDGNPYGGAQVAAYLNAQSVTQRLNHVVPGRWRQQFEPLATSADQDGSRKRYLLCRLTITLPAVVDGPNVDAVYEDIGEMDAGSLAGVKALYSDARKRAAVAAGIGAYLYTALAPLVLAVGDGPRQVQSVRRGQGKKDLLTLSGDTEQWLRHGYAKRMASEAVIRDLGPILTHGEPEIGMGQGEVAEVAEPAAEPALTAASDPPAAASATPVAITAAGHGNPAAQGNGVVSVDFGGLDPAA